MGKPTEKGQSAAAEPGPCVLSACPPKSAKGTRQLADPVYSARAVMRPVVFVAPFPLETTLRFVRAAARLSGVKLLGVVAELRRSDAHVYADVAKIRDPLSTKEIIKAITHLARRHGKPHRIVGILEPLQVQLALARKHFGVPGNSPELAHIFRDKSVMKTQLQRAGVPVARNQLLATRQGAERFSQQVGFPLVLKPPAGMGAKATFRVHSNEELIRALEGMRATPQQPVLAEELLLGQEGSFDALTTGGRVRDWSISYYTPTPLTVLENPWIQWQCLLPRQVNTELDRRVATLGTQVIDALGLSDGLTHMEWFARPDGSLAVGEIAQRPPGANITRMIGLANGIDPYRAWARAEIDGDFDGPWNRRWAVGCAYLRGMGRGRVAGVTGVSQTNEAIAPHVVEAKLPTVGAPKNDSYEGDGYLIVQDPKTEVVQKALRIAIENIRVHYA